MAKNKDDAVSKIEELKAELKSLKGKKKKRTWTKNQKRRKPRKMLLKSKKK